MLSSLTLLDLKNKALSLNKTGRVMPNNEEMVAYQAMVWERILSLCFPLNLVVPYNDGNICKIAVYEDCTYWYSKSPVIAKVDADYIDIDSRLKEAFVFYFIAFLSLRGKDNNREEWEQRANRVCLEYSCDVSNMGIAKAKMTYEQYSGITGVKFNCNGARYEISPTLVDAVISCMLCENVCTNTSMAKQIERYKTYLSYQRKVNAGEEAVFTLLPSYFSSLRALDIGLLLYLMEHMELVEKYGIEKIDRITTLSCELGKKASGEEVADWVKAVDMQLGAEYGSL